jgi:hypothetical protein
MLGALRLGALSLSKRLAIQGKIARERASYTATSPLRQRAYSARQ